MIDVTVATLNSSKTIGKCLNSIHENIPHRKIAVVDGGSSDNTLEICKSFGTEIVSAPRALLGETRFLQALHCETRWIIYMDSDVYVGPKWWPRVRRELGKRVGIINSRCRVKCSDPDYHRFFIHEWKRRIPRINVSFSNTVTKRHLVLECRKLKRVHAGEDAIFFDSVKQQGLRIKTVPGYLAYHDRDIYLHHPSAYYRMGFSIPSSNSRILRLLLRKNLQCLIFMHDTKRVSLKLWLYLNRLAVNRAAGAICSKLRN